ncbi:ABC transporter ATP-binding protein YtrB [Andreprevotia sp. IGB-42]|uniref:ABC transporter ATP-binding protein n=1 Tax=Andreprevotia sp. IGB-42 TaxID=2497473 RepID=UPI001356C1CE|nr:ABC transporter ATP-binding protein [Andreprevotia sp. IGB-42]KAF0813428.1 ABC transporter ATP-binding protein YtrB [Andreprevotia sp. IGB-42]
MTQPLLQLASVAKSYGLQRVLGGFGGLNWQVEPGRIHGLLGRNGAGKSTLLECALGLRDVDLGTITLLDENPATLSDAGRARIGYVPQKAELFGWMTATQMLAYFRSFYPRWNQPKTDSLLDRWDIARDKPIARLSVGEQQRLSIIRALAPEPDLLILDEPVASLDPAGRRDFLRELVDDVLERGSTVVFSTHILSDLERVAMDVAFLHEGQIALQAPLDDLLDSVRRITGPAAALEQLALKPLSRMLGHTGQTSVVARITPFQQQLLASNPVLVHAPVSLEDLFIEVTR